MTQSGCSDKVAVASGPDAPAAAAAPAETADPFTPIVQTAPSGLSVRWLPYGATLMEVRLPDGTPILAGLSDPRDYAGDHPCLGSMIGRVANRIDEACFEIDGTRFEVAATDDGNALHSGPDGFDSVVWDVDRDGEVLVFRHTSPAGDQGYPGHLDVTVRATLTDQALELRLLAITDVPTPVNLTQHGYWNPAGTFAVPIDALTIQSPADRYTEVGPDMIPTGIVPPVDGTALDFRQARPIGPAAIDINLLVPGEGLREMVRLTDGETTLSVLSDYPGVQLFTGEPLGGVEGMVARGALAIEPQHPPDAVNQPVDGHDTVLRPGEVYRHTILYRFDGPAFGEVEE